MSPDIVIIGSGMGGAMANPSRSNSILAVGAGSSRNCRFPPRRR